MDEYDERERVDKMSPKDIQAALMLIRAQDVRPFVVYASDSPIYPEQMWQCRMIGAREETREWFGGTALAISAGIIEMDSENGEQPFMNMGCLLENPDPMMIGFAERLVSRLVEPDDRVLICYHKQHAYDDRCTPAAAEFGFEVFETEEMTVCLGNGGLLPGLRWLWGVIPLAETRLVASDGTLSELESNILAAARRGKDVPGILMDFEDEVDEDPSVVQKKLAGVKLHASLGGTHKGDMALNFSQPMSDEVHSIIRDLAADAGFTLYNGGSLSLSDQPGAFFKSALVWTPIPSAWTQVIQS